MKRWQHYCCHFVNLSTFHCIPSPGGLMSYSYFSRCRNHRGFLEVNIHRIHLLSHNLSPAAPSKFMFVRKVKLWQLQQQCIHIEYNTWVMKLCAPVRPSSSPVLKRKMTECLKPCAQFESVRTSSSIRPTHELQSPAPPLQLYSHLVISLCLSTSNQMCIRFNCRGACILSHSYSTQCNSVHKIHLWIVQMRQ